MLLSLILSGVPQVDESMRQHDDLLKMIAENEDELDGIVGRRRKDFSGDFFAHLRLRCEASYKDLAEQESECVGTLNPIL